MQIFFVILLVVAVVLFAVSRLDNKENNDSKDNQSDSYNEIAATKDVTLSSNHSSDTSKNDDSQSIDSNVLTIEKSDTPKESKNIYLVVTGTRSYQNDLKRIANQYKREYGLQSFDGISNKEFIEDFYSEMSEFEGQPIYGVEFKYDSLNPSSSINVYIPDVTDKLNQVGYVDRSVRDQLKHELENNEIIEAYGEFTGGKIKYSDYDFEKDKDIVLTKEASRGFEVGIRFANAIHPNPPKPKHKDYMKYTKARKLTDKYVVIDFETTGFNASENEIIQIGAVKYENNQEVDSFTSLIKPTIELPSKITKITGITQSDLKDAPSIESELPKLLEFIGGYDLVAHNASFDMEFLLFNIHKYDFPYKKYRAIDTLPLARKHFTTKNHKLATLKEHLKLEQYKSHSALDDCYVTSAVYQHCYELENN